MLDSFLVLFPVFALILAGYTLVKKGVVDQTHIPSLGKFVIYLALPCMIIAKVNELDLSQAISAQFILTYGLGSVAVYTLVFLATLFILKKSRLQAAVNGHGASFSNSSFLIFPILYQSIGEMATAPFIMALLVENLLLMPLVLGMSDYASQSGQGSSFLRTVGKSLGGLGKHPIILSVFLGVLLNVLHVPLPEPIHRFLDLAASATVSVALFYIGATLAGIQLGKDLLQINMVALSKLILHPTIVFVLGYFVFGLDPFLLSVVVIFASASSMSIYPILVDRFGFSGFASGVVLLSTVLSPIVLFVTLSFLPK